MFRFAKIDIKESVIKIVKIISIILLEKNLPLPILLWSYGMLTIEELDKLYSFLFQKME